MKGCQIMTRGFFFLHLWLFLKHAISLNITVYLMMKYSAQNGIYIQLNCVGTLYSNFTNIYLAQPFFRGGLL